eukprot:2428130-Amphidinium_carterae.1
MDVFREFAASKLAPDARTFAVIIRGCIATSDWHACICAPIHWPTNCYQHHTISCICDPECIILAAP